MRPSRRQDARGPAVDVVIASTRWSKAPQAAKLVRRTIAAAAPARAKKAELSVILTSNRAIGALNRQWRGQDKPTNVLSFPAPKQATKRTAKRAATRGAPRKPFDHHLAHLAVHGFLHLLGYDHESDSEAEAMERRERMILSRLGVPDPYAARDADD
jgi:probable rRNA maturation factor